MRRSHRAAGRPGRRWIILPPGTVVSLFLSLNQDTELRVNRCRLATHSQTYRRREERTQTLYQDRSEGSQLWTAERFFTRHDQSHLREQTLTDLPAQSVSMLMSAIGILVRCAGTWAPGPAPSDSTLTGMSRR